MNSVSILLLVFVVRESYQQNSAIVLQHNFEHHENSRLLHQVLVNFLSQLAPENPQPGNFCDLKITGEDKNLYDNYDKIISRPFLHLNSHEFEFSFAFSFGQMIFTTKSQNDNEFLNQNASYEEKIQQLHDDFNINKNNFLDIRRLSFQCSTALVFLEKQVEFKSEFNSAENLIESVRKRSGNRRPESTHFIFMANEQSQIQRDFKENQAILRLKYKTGISTGIDIKIMTEVNAERKFHFQSVSMSMGKLGENSGAVPKFPFPFCSVCGGKIKTAMLALEPFVILNEKKEPILGYFYKALVAIKNQYNLTTVDEYGLRGIKQLPNGSWTGYLNELSEHRLDLLSPLGATFARFPYFDFTTCLEIVDVTFYTAHPQISINWQAIFYPFQPFVWLLIGVSLICSIPIFYLQMTLPSSGYFSLTNRFRLRKNPIEHSHRNSQEKSVAKKEAAFYSVILPFCALLQESRKVPRKVRYLYGCFLFYSIILGVGYTSNLISFLSFPEPEKVPSTFSELSKRPDFTYTFTSIPGSAGDLFFQHTSNPVFMTIQSRLIYTRNYAQCIISAALQKKQACVTWPLNANSIVSKNLTLYPNFNPLKNADSAVSMKVNVVMPRYSKYYSGFNGVFIWLRDTGHLDFWKAEAINYRKKQGREWMMSQKEVQGSLYKPLDKLSRETLRLTTHKPFGLKNFVVCFAWLILGLTLSTLSFFFEMMQLMLKTQKNGKFETLKKQLRFCLQRMKGERLIT